MSKKILTSFGFEKHKEYLQIASPTFSWYASKFEYDLFIPSQNYFSSTIKNKPYSWWKIELFQKLFKEYDQILWLDSDVIICNFNEDIFDSIPTDHDIGVVVHETDQGQIPNCGVWALNKSCLSWLDKLWELDNFKKSWCWWEQAALMSIIGFDMTLDYIPLPEKSNIEWTQLDYAWNIHPYDKRGMLDHPKGFHATMYQDTAYVMRSIASQIRI